MQLTANQDCTRLTGTFDSPVALERYIENLQYDGSRLLAAGICCYSLELSYNCCEPVTYQIRALFPLTMELVDCDEADGGVLSFALSGIHLSCISSMYYINPLNQRTEITNFRVAPIAIYLPYRSSQSAYFQIYTCEGLMYQIRVILSMNVDEVCSTTIVNQILTYPTLPQGVSFRQNTNGDWVFLDLTPEAFGLPAGEFPIGIYRASLFQDNIPLTDDTFVNCGLHCDIATHLVKHPDSIIYNLFQALVNSETCNNLTTEERCQLWSYIALELGYIRQHSDCGCN